MDFTLQKYSELLDIILKADYRITRFDKWLENGKQPGMILRHDIDRRPKNALKIARIEHSKGITSTYYFRTKKCSFNEHIIKTIAELGHETGYHYENISDCSGNREKAIENFKENLSCMREVSEIKTICMHGRPFSKWDNKKLWETYDYKEYGIIGEPFLDTDSDQIKYFNDTGRTWHPRRFNRRDFLGIDTGFAGSSTDQLINFLKEAKDHNSSLMLLTHPERWDSPGIPFIIQFFKDSLINILKTFVIIASKSSQTV